MKRTFSIILALVMLLTTAALPVHAVEPNTNENNKIIALACQAFPEYVDIIRGDTVANQNARSSNQNVELIFSETRHISESQYVSLTYFSNGRALLATVEHDVYYHEVELDGRIMYGTISADFTYTGFSGAFTLKNVTYVINPNGSDYFTSFGSATCTGYNRIESRCQPNNSANLVYSIVFLPSANPTPSQIIPANCGFEIVNETLVVEASTSV